MNLGLEIYKLYKNILFGQVLYLLVHGQSYCFSFLNVKYNEHIRIVLFRITYDYIVSRKKSLRKCHIQWFIEHIMKSDSPKSIKKLRYISRSHVSKWFHGYFMENKKQVPWTYLILTMSPRHFKVENTIDFEIELQLRFYFKSHCDSRENTWSSSGVVLFDCFCHSPYKRPKKVGIYVFLITPKLFKWI